MYMMIGKQRFVAARVVLTLAAAVTLTVTLGACATKGDLRDLQTEIRALAARQDTLLSQLRMQASSTQDSVRTQSDQMFDFRGEITRQMREIARALSTIEALAGQNQTAIAGVRDQLTNLRTVASAPPRTVAPDSTEALVQGGGDPEGLYRTATDQMNRGSLNTARAAFEEFVSRYANHDFAADAHYNLADILFQQESLEEALAAFQEVQVRFPIHARVRDARYRSGLVQIAMGDLEAAEETLELVVNTYPGTIVAELAAEKLDEIR
jgi:tol-pal system protein YbgF